jgi:hypothetical protein
MSSSAADQNGDNLIRQLTDKYFDCAATGNLEEVKSLVNG